MSTYVFIYLSVFVYRNIIFLSAPSSSAAPGSLSSSIFPSLIFSKSLPVSFSSLYHVSLFSFASLSHHLNLLHPFLLSIYLYFKVSLCLSHYLTPLPYLLPSLSRLSLPLLFSSALSLLFVLHLFADSSLAHTLYTPQRITELNGTAQSVTNYFSTVSVINRRATPSLTYCDCD